MCIFVSLIIYIQKTHCVSSMNGISNILPSHVLDRMSLTGKFLTWWFTLKSFPELCLAQKLMTLLLQQSISIGCRQQRKAILIHQSGSKQHSTSSKVHHTSLGIFPSSDRNHGVSRKDHYRNDMFLRCTIPTNSAHSHPDSAQIREPRVFV